MIQFLVDHIQRKSKTVLVSELPPALDQALVAAGLKATVRTLLSRAQRAAVKRGERPTKKTAITRAELEAMLATCDDSLEGLRDRALLCFGFASGGRRRSEIAAADMRDLRRVGDDGHIYRLEFSKTQQAGVGGFNTGQADPGAQRRGLSSLARGRWDRRRSDLPADLEGAGRPRPAPGISGRDREAPSPRGGLRGGFWGS